MNTIYIKLHLVIKFHHSFIRTCLKEIQNNVIIVTCTDMYSRNLI